MSSQITHPAGALSHTYDNDGQLASASGTPYTFNYDHRLAGIGTTAQFSYDGRGNRLSATRAGVTTSYIYDPWRNLLADADSNGVTHKYTYGKGLLAVVTSAGRYCYHFNAIGSTVALTDVNQNVVNSYAYDPFGTVLDQQETVTQPFRYVGQYGVMAEPNGLCYMREGTMIRSGLREGMLIFLLMCTTIRSIRLIRGDCAPALEMRESCKATLTTLI